MTREMRRLPFGLRHLPTPRAHRSLVDELRCPVALKSAISQAGPSGQGLVREGEVLLLRLRLEKIMAVQ